MRAINLIPDEERRGAGGSAGRSGGAVYVLLGALAAAVVLTALYVTSTTKVDERRAELARVEQQTAAAQSQAAALAAYTTFATMRQTRVDTVRSLATSRFDWSHALREVARVLPAGTALSCINGTVTGTVSSAGGCSAGDASQLRQALAVPALELSGCTTSNKAVADLISRLRQIDGVQRVSLASAAKPDGAPGAAGASPDAVSCKGGDQAPTFALVVFFTPGAGPAAPRGPQVAAAGPTGIQTPAAQAAATTVGGTTP
jgi:Tfp pilus assembly protein PilN